MAKKEMEEMHTQEEIKAQEQVAGDNIANSILEKLVMLYTKQKLDKQVDDYQVIRGELPIEVRDIEDEIEGLNTRLAKFKDEVDAINDGLVEKQEMIEKSVELVKKYEEQQMNVRNNREYESIAKELNFQNLEIQLIEKRIKEAKETLKLKKEEVKKVKEKVKDRKSDLVEKKKELKDIEAETNKEEDALLTYSKTVETGIEKRLLVSYNRIRNNAKNGLAVVKIERDACGGCFSKIPPQRQLDIQTHKKIIVCEYCGRILVDDEIAAQADIKLQNL